jgi:hypothetical protein
MDPVNVFILYLIVSIFISFLVIQILRLLHVPTTDRTRTLIMFSCIILVIMRLYNDPIVTAVGFSMIMVMLLIYNVSLMDHGHGLDNLIAIIPRSWR